jgi:hypothetical protein
MKMLGDDMAAAGPTRSASGSVSQASAPSMEPEANLPCAGDTVTHASPSLVHDTRLRSDAPPATFAPEHSTSSTSGAEAATSSPE